MWTARKEWLTDADGLRYVVDREARPATVAEIIRGWESDAEFRTLFNALLADAPFTAFRWETPAVTTDALARAFEFVLLDSPGLDRRPDPTAFAEHFQANAQSDAVSFANLGGNAVMIAPRPIADPSAYGHIGAFVRLAPERQRHDLWQLVGQAMTERVGKKPVWLSTAGAGVSWLHVRLDDSPKYYGYRPYRRLPA